MRLKDLDVTMFEFGRSETHSALSTPEGHDLGSLPHGQAQVILDLFTERSHAIWWLYNRLSEADQDAFMDYINDPEAMPVHLRLEAGDRWPRVREILEDQFARGERTRTRIAKDR